jgi:hypothetical protein
MTVRKIDNRIIRPLTIIFIIALIIIIWAIYDHSQSVDLKTRQYSSTEYDFTILYPGTPKTTHISKTVDNISAETTFISSSVENGSQHFEIYASNLPQVAGYNSLTNQQKITALTAGIDSGITVLLNATAINTTKSSFLGYPAVYTQFKTSVKGANINGYGRSFVIGNSDYIILSTGASRSNFLKFANSFKYIGKQGV